MPRASESPEHHVRSPDIELSSPSLQLHDNPLYFIRRPNQIIQGGSGQGRVAQISLKVSSIGPVQDSHSVPAAFWLANDPFTLYLALMTLRIADHDGCASDQTLGTAGLTLSACRCIPVRIQAHQHCMTCLHRHVCI